MTIAIAIFGLFMILLGGFIIWGVLSLEKLRKENRDYVMNAPKFIIKPSHDLGFDIWEKTLVPLPGHAPLMFYSPLFGQYKTLAEAEAQLAHYNKSSGGGS